MLTIAYIGNGKGANRYHLPYSTNIKNIRVKTIYNRSIKDDWAKIEGVNYTTNIEDVYNDPEIQMVVVTTPDSTHYSFAKEALEHGKHVLVEKPFCGSSAEAKELFALAKEKGLFIQAYQNRRFDSDFMTTKKVIESGVLGDILEVEINFDYYNPEAPESSREFSSRGSFLYGIGSHTVDQAISLFGKPDDIHFDVRQLLGSGRMNDYYDIDLSYGPTKVSVKSSYFRLKARPSFIVYGKKGVFIKETIDRQEFDLKKFYMPSNDDFGLDKPEHYGTLTYMDENNVYHEEKVITEVGDYGKIYEGAYESIINGKEKIVKDEETILSMEILEKGVEGLS